MVPIRARSDVAEAKRPGGDDLHRRRPVRQVRHGVPRHVGQLDLTNGKIREGQVRVTIADGDAHHFDVVGLQAIAFAVAPCDANAGLDVGKFDFDAIALAAFATGFVRLDLDGVLGEEA